MSFSLEHFPPQAPSSGDALLMLPGGGYSILAAHEGAGYAKHFSRAGVDCQVVSYPLAGDGHRHRP